MPLFTLYQCDAIICIFNSLLNTFERSFFIQNLKINLHNVNFLYFMWELIPSIMTKIRRLALLSPGIITSEPAFMDDKLQFLNNIGQFRNT